MPTLDVKWLLPDGSGAGPVEGGTVRVPGALPGDVVRWREVDRRGRTRIGALVEVVEPSPARRDAPCPWHAPCGGCDLGAMEPAARRASLAELVRHAFRRDAPPEVVPSPRATGHRARIKLALHEGEVGYRGAGSHDLVAIGHCLVARPEVDEALQRLRAWATPERTEGLASVEIRSDGERVVYAFRSARRGVRLQPDTVADLGAVALDGGVVHGDPTLWLQVDGLRLRASPNSFYQVNLEVNALLAAHVRATVAAADPQRVLDLYAGIGNLALGFAADGAPVAAVELEGQATADLRAAAGAQGLSDRVEVVTEAAQRFDPRTQVFDVAVLDPPRAGARGLLAEVVLNRPRRIVYVACNPPRAARDVREAQEAGYAIVDVRCFDMFPDTHHVEAVVVLDR